MEPLSSAKHEHFAQLVSNGENATRAYVLAGYSENGAKQSAARLLTNADLCARIAYLRSKKEEAHGQSVQKVLQEAALDKAWVLKRLARIVDMGMAAEPVKDADGNPSGEYRANLNAANKALELIGKEAGMFIDRKEIRTGELDGLGHDELKQLRDALTAVGGAGQTTGTFSASEGRATH